LSLFFIFVVAVSAVSAAYEYSLDEQGPDDEPGQKDLNQLATEDAPTPPVDYQVQIWWDQSGWNGSNTGDACIMIDTNGNDLADWALCETVHNDPAEHLDTNLYQCLHDSRVDRCGGPEAVLTFTSTCTATTLVGADPFHPGEDDAVATCYFDFDDLGGATEFEVTDVCSFPSQEPNSDPSDCIFTPTDPTAIVGSQALAARSGMAGFFLAGAFGLLLLGTAAVGYRALSVRRPS
jgi:hypothetical protein